MNKILASCILVAFSMQTFAAATTKKTSAHSKTATSQKRSPATESAPTQVTPMTPSTASSTTTTSYAPLFAPGHNELFLTVTSGKINTGNNTTNINFEGMYGFMLNNHVELGAEMAIGSISYQGGSRTSTDLFAVGIYNFGMAQITDDAFAFGALGVASVPNKFGNNESKFGFKAGGGKRISMWSKVQLVPQLWVEKAGDLDPNIVIQPVNFSVIF